MDPKRVNVLVLKYSIRFDDADDGEVYAGDGCRIVGVYQDGAEALRIASEFNPILAQAEKETIVFPVQEFNARLQGAFGFVLHDVDPSGYEFSLKVESFEVK